MPYKSEKQRKMMYSQHPEVAAKWEKEGKNFVEKAKERQDKRKGRSGFGRVSKRANSRKSGR